MMVPFAGVRFLVLLSLVGCGVVMEYDSPATPSRTAGARQRCYERDRLEATAGSAEISWGRLYAEYRLETPGVAFYHRGRRLGVPRAFALLDDEELRRVYEHRRASLRRAGLFYGFATAGALGFTGLGAGFAVKAMTDEAGVPIVLASVAGTVASFALFLWARSRLGRWNGMHRVYSGLLIDGTLAARVREAIDRHNRAVARRCGYHVISIPVP